jgi:hypothetical protein
VPIIDSNERKAVPTRWPFVHWHSSGYASYIAAGIVVRHTMSLCISRLFNAEDRHYYSSSQWLKKLDGTPQGVKQPSDVSMRLKLNIQ